MLASEAFRRLQVAKCLPVKHIGVFKAQKWVFMSGFSAMCEVTLRGLPFRGRGRNVKKNRFFSGKNVCLRRLGTLNASQ